MSRMRLAATMEDPVDIPIAKPPVINYLIGYLIVGLAWGFTTPFIRKAARTHTPPSHPTLEREDVKKSWFKRTILGAIFGVSDLLRNWRYALPLVINLTGSIWFFLLIGKAGELPDSLCDTLEEYGPVFVRRRNFRRRRLTCSRVELDSAYHELYGVPVYSPRRMVRGKEGHKQR